MKLLSPLSLWQSEVYWQTFVTILLCLFAAGTLVFLFRTKNHYLKMSWWSLKSWLVAAPIMLLIAGAPQPWPLLFLTVLAIAGAKTFFKIMGIYHQTPFVVTCYLGVIALSLASYYQRIDIYNLIPMMALGVMCLIPIFLNKYKNMLQYISLSFIALIFLGWGFMHLGLILNLENGIYQLIYLVLLTEFCDNTNIATAGYFKKPRRFDQVMSKRTYGSTILSICLTLAFAFLLKNVLPVPSQVFWLSAGLVASFAGGLGNIILNIIRRDIGIKIVGGFILGRGDFLSRMDRIIFVAPIYYHLITWLKAV